MWLFKLHQQDVQQLIDTAIKLQANVCKNTLQEHFKKWAFQKINTLALRYITQHHHRVYFTKPAVLKGIKPKHHHGKQLYSLWTHTAISNSNSFSQTASTLLGVPFGSQLYHSALPSLYTQNSNKKILIPGGKKEHFCFTQAVSSIISTWGENTDESTFP